MVRRLIAGLERPSVASVRPHFSSNRSIMKSILVCTSVLAGMALAAPSLAQTTPADDTGWRMPHERGFWGHAGISAGQAELDVNCAAGAVCDTDSAFLRAFAGGRFNNAVGMEVGFVNFGKFKVNGGDT